MKKRVLLFWGCLASGALVAGERLHNAIVLPDEWPPANGGAVCAVPEVVAIDVGRQLFVDDFLIWETDGVERIFPELQSAGDAVFRTGGKGSFCVWRDPDAGVFRMWYGEGDSGTVRMAVSDDGFGWKDSQRALPADMAAESWSVSADSVNPAAGEKWKMLVRGPGGDSPCVAMVSDDGVNWKRRALLGDAPGPAAAFFDPFRRKWIFSAADASSGYRNYFETYRFLEGKCDSLQRWMQADGFCAVAYESLMLGLIEKRTAGGAAERRFVYSRDGFNWSKEGANPVLSAAGDVKMAGNLCVVDGDKLLFHYDDGRGGKKVAVLRRDGFAGLKAGGRGVVTTRKVVFRGDRLFVNVDAPAGRLSVEVLDVDGRRLAYSGGIVSGDHTKKEVVFSEGTLWRITGRPVRFRFTLENCTLYSFWTSASRNGASGGYLAGGGRGHARLRDIAPVYGESIDAIDVLAGGGDAFRGATVPSGTLQLAPRTVGADGVAGRYRYGDRTIEGFAFAPGSGRLLAMPVAGTQHGEGKWRSRFSHDREKAEAGYYMVDLLSGGIRAEMTATVRSGAMRFTYPGDERRLVRFALDGAGSFSLRRSGERTLECGVPAGGEGRGGCRIEFSEPLAGFKSVAAGVWIAEFPAAEIPLVMKVGEADGRSFREMHDEARRLWAQAFAGTENGDATARYRELSGAKALAPDAPAVKDAKAWKFFDRRLGMFVHWGIYSVGAWHEQEWMRRRMRLEDYAKYAGRFTASAFNADELVAVAESAGARYIVVTTKHHDGFCMWDTKTTDFSSMHAASGRDLVGEIAAACRRRGIRLGFYYSNPDWHHPSAYNALSTHQLVDAQPGHVPDMKHYLNYVRAQIRELMTNYGEICCLFWDIPSRIEVPELNAMVRALQPGIVINDRGWGSSGDYSTPEREVPPGSAFPRPTEACDSVGAQSWGYRANEDYRTLGYLTRAIDRMLSRGGNFLLNVGPKSDGTLPKEAVSLMKRVGEWYGKVRESYRDVETVPGLVGGDVIVTRRGDTVYLHYPNGIHSAGLNLSPLGRMPRKAEILNAGVPLKPVLETLPGSFFAGRGETLRLVGVPAEELCGESTVIRLDF
jgi:alpha-L-fucosidase